MTDWAWIVLVFGALFALVLHFGFSAIVKSLAGDSHD